MKRTSTTFIVLCVLASCSCQFFDDLQDNYESCVGENKFLCTSGTCIDGELWCNGYIDCSDGSDENFCEGHKPDALLCNVTHQFMCADQSDCIPLSWLCNNETECPDASDEANCTALPPPPANATCQGFQCGDGTCISRLWVCDGRYDCSDSSDEMLESCKHALFTHAISAGALCDETTVGNRERQYRCMDESYCLSPDFMCNGIPDCRDGSDEGPFCENWDTVCINSTCKGHSHCTPDRNGPVCSCAPSANLKYNYMTETCEPENICQSLVPTCSQKCVSSDGLQCSCEEGYTTNMTSNLCFATGPEGLLFYSTPNEINFLMLKSKLTVTIASSTIQAHGVACSGSHAYWAQRADGHQAVLRAHIAPPHAAEVLLAIGLEDPGDIAIDYLGGNIYLSDTGRGYIIACKPNGAWCTIINTKTINPKFVTLDPPNGKMYWADKHTSPVIMEASMDGSSPEILVDTLYNFANGLALDRPNDRLYFIDGTIKVVRLDDKLVYSLFRDAHHHPYSLTVFENSVYWSDWTSNSLQRGDKLQTSQESPTILLKLNTHITGLHVYHPLLFKSKVNPCAESKCSHLCFVTSNSTHKCGCPSGYRLEGDNCQIRTGYRPEYLVIGSGANFTRIQLDVFSNPQIHATIFDIGTVQAMTMDTNDTLYFYDGQRKSINYITMDDFTLGITHVLIYSGLVNVVDMGYDYATDSLYWVDEGARSVEVYSLRSQHRTIVYRFIGGEKPISLCVLVDYGMLMVAVMENDLSEEVHVDSITMDGQYRKHLIMNNLKGPHVMLRYSHTTQHVFVLDEGWKFIDFIHPEGTHRGNYVTLPSYSSVKNLAISESFVFWTGKKSKTLYWAGVHEVRPKVRRMDLSLFSPSSLLLGASQPPLRRSSPYLSHPCSGPVCSHICVQRPHAPPPAHALPYSCLCPPAMLLLGSDCVDRTSCNHDQLYCRNSNECVRKTAMCDGNKDCLHGEDEEGCQNNKVIVCEAHEVNCNGECVDVHQGCKTAEGNTTEPVKCTIYEFECNNDTSFCLDIARICDGTEDCADGSDEERCSISMCSEDMFMCASGSCIINTWKCDGEEDCNDGSDEINCSKKSCAMGLFPCSSGECVEMRRRCDSRVDCRDRSDELDCVMFTTDMTEVGNQECAAWEYPCEFNASICLPLTVRCNGHVECPGGTDELGCDQCSQHGLFFCAEDRKCISTKYICDGKHHCSDGADETQQACYLANRNVPTSHHYSPNVQGDCQGFRCLHGECLDLSQVCDGTKDCFDDEGPLCSVKCGNKSCSQQCHATAAGPRCFCYPGFSLAADRSTCADVDECAADVCPQRCHNAPGTFLCSCHPGYALRAEHRSCKALSGQLSVLFVQGADVRAVDAGGLAAVYYRDPALRITDITYHVKKQLLYITDSSNGKLVEVNSTKKSVVISNIGKPAKVTVDWVTGNVYFVDNSRDNSFIRVCNVGKRRCAKLQSVLRGHQVTAIAVDPVSHLLFYCVTQDLESIIISSSLYGKNINDVTTARNCTGLAVDTFLDLLYIAESTGFSRVGYDGANRRTIIANSPHFESPMGIALFEDYIYFLVANSFKFNRCLLYGNKRCEPFYWRLFDANTFVLKHKSIQRDDLRDECEGFECPNVCVSSKSGPICVCVDGSLAINGKCSDSNVNEMALFAGGAAGGAGSRVSAPLLAAVVTALTAYAAFFAYYHFVYRKKRDTDYTEVRFSQNPEGVSSEPIIDMAAAGRGGREFNNPLQMMRDAWKASFRVDHRPIGTAGLTINIPTAPEQDLSDTESDLDDQDTMKIMHALNRKK